VTKNILHPHAWKEVVNAHTMYNWVFNRMKKKMFVFELVLRFHMYTMSKSKMYVY
jgi:hypothetical protein